MCKGIGAVQLSVFRRSVCVAVSATTLSLGASLGTQVSASSTHAAIESASDQLFLDELLSAINERPELLDHLTEAAQDARPDLAKDIDQIKELASNRGADRTGLSAGESASDPGLPQSVTIGLATVAAAVGVGGIAAAAGGGGSTDTGNGITGPVLEPLDFETAEYTDGRGLDAINASSAYARGVSGNGIVVAVLDSGVDIDHPDLVANLTANGYDFIDDDADASPADQGGFRSHGTHVAGTIAAVNDGIGMHGVAYNAKILPIRVGISNGQVLGAAQIDAYDYVLAQQAAGQNIRVLNASFGGAFNPVTAARIEAITDAGIVFVASAGNDGLADPAFPAALPTVAGFNFNGRLMAVGCYDPATGALCGFSNRAGTSLNHYIVAPGQAINSTFDLNDNTDLDGDGYGLKSGTSMSAPHVAGAVAVLMEAFPHLASEEIVQILFDTATDLGAPGVDADYGHGLLNLDAATQPLGTVGIATGGTVGTITATLGGSALRLSSSFGDGLTAGLAGKQLAVFDSYNRAFLIDLDRFAQAASTSFDLEGAVQRFAREDERQRFDLPTGTSFSFSATGSSRQEFFGADPDARTDNDDAPGVGSFMLTQSFGQSSVSASYNVDPREQIGLWSSDLVGEDKVISEDAFASPYLSFLGDAWGTAASVALTPDLSLNFGGFMGSYLDETADTESRTSAAMAEFVVRPDDGVRIGLEFGALSEQGRFLGSETTGAFAVGEESWTGYVGANIAYGLTDSWSLVASAYQGFTRAALASDSLISEMSTIRSESFSLGIVGQSVFTAEDQLMFSVSQPLRVASGSATFDIPTGRDLAGNVLSNSFSTNLTPSGREIDLEASYSLKLSETQSLSTGVMMRMQPGHTSGSTPEAVGMVRYRVKF